jgi:hypothetical protein
VGDRQHPLQGPQLSGAVGGGGGEPGGDGSGSGSGNGSTRPSSSRLAAELAVRTTRADGRPARDDTAGACSGVTGGTGRERWWWLLWRMGEETPHSTPLSHGVKVPLGARLGLDGHSCCTAPCGPCGWRGRPQTAHPAALESAQPPGPGVCDGSLLAIPMGGLAGEGPDPACEQMAASASQLS